MKKNLGKILLIVLPVLIALFLLYPTYKASDLEKKHDEAIARAAKAKTPADSLAIMDSFEKSYGEAYRDAKQKRLKLGLDLRGGMYVTLEVDIVKLLDETAQPEAKDEIFNEVINKTRQEAQSSEEDVLTIFKRNFDQIAKPKRKFLSDYFDFGGNVADSEDKIMDKLKENEADAIDQAMQVIRQRIDKYGISEPTIQKQGSRRVMLELPGVQNEAEVRQLISVTARLDFKLVRSDENLVSAFYKIDQYLAKQAKIGGAPVDTSAAPKTDSTVAANENTKVISADSAKNKEKGKEKAAGKDQAANADTAKTDSAAQASKKTADTSNPYAGLSQTEAQKRYMADHPFTSMFETTFMPAGRNQRAQRVSYVTNAFPKGDYNFQIVGEFVPKFKEILSRQAVKDLLPEGVEVLLGAKPIVGKEKNGKEFKIYSFYGLKKDPELTGEYISDAQASFDPTNNQPIVLMSMNSEGSDKWANITGANIGKRVAIVLDQEVYSAPTVQNKIVGGSSQITGMANAEEAKLLKIVLKAGALKAPIQMIEERVVGPSLGEDSINAGVSASLIAFGLVILFMLIYYTAGGVVADLSVIINVLLVIAVLAAFGGTLSLPGIAGIILTIGMAVDANVLIYERIREEVYKGRSLKSAIDEGFSKAMSAILDSNITTFITGVILYFFGTGPIKGFALTLMIGILATLFTQILVSRAMIEIASDGGRNHFSFGQPKEVIE